MESEDRKFWPIFIFVIFLGFALKMGSESFDYHLDKLDEYCHPEKIIKLKPAQIRKIIDSSHDSDKASQILTEAILRSKRVHEVDTETCLEAISKSSVKAKYIQQLQDEYHVEYDLQWKHPYVKNLKIKKKA